MKTIHMVSTLAVIQERNPGLEICNTGRPGIMSMPLEIDRDKFTSKFGRWLAESIATTDRSDDLGNIWITRRATRWDDIKAQFAAHFATHSPTDTAGISADLERVEAWVCTQREIVRMYGEGTLLEPRRELFAWPVLGSHAADGI